MSLWNILDIPRRNQFEPNGIFITTEYSTVLKARTDYMFCAGFFCTRKNFFTFFQNHATNHTLLYRYGAERGINTFHVITERGCDYETVGLPKDSTMSIRLQAKTCSQEHCTKYRKELRRRRNKEISFCELPEIVVEKLAVWDDYETDYTIFSVCGIDIRVLDDELAEALKKLPERKRNTLLMYYFLEMTESEIANLQKITQSGVFRNRHHALETMKKILKEEH